MAGRGSSGRSGSGWGSTGLAGGRAPQVAGFSLLELLSVLLLLCLWHAIPAHAQDGSRNGNEASAEVPAAWQTVAERSGFRATGRLEDAVTLLEKIAAEAPEVHLTTFGTSGLGRPMPLVIVSEERAFTPQAAARLAAEKGKPVVLIQNGIHAGEIDGKDASLMILRDLALGSHRDLLEAATLLIVPVLNVDGHERVSPYHRANQNGPVEGMGFRTTPHGLDLNRDHLKLESREMRALVELFLEWRPHLHLDNHVTDGSEHDWVLTWSWLEAPQMPASLDRWMDRHMPPVLAATEAAGHPLGPYVSLVDWLDPTKGFSSRVANPWYATGYFPLRNTPSILVEMAAPHPYRQRVLANRDFMVELIRGLRSAGRDLVAAVRDARSWTVARGREDAAPSDVVITWATDPEADRIDFPVHPWRIETSVVSGQPVLLYEPRPEDLEPLEVPWLHGSLATLAVPRPRGYLVAPGWPQVAEVLAAQGLEVERLTTAMELQVETIRVSDAELAGSSYQGHVRVSAPARRRTESRRIPAGSLWIPAAQPDFEVAVQLLEPEAVSSLFAWGLLHTVTETKEFMSPRNLEAWARRRLAEDGELAAEWRGALEDEELAADPRARFGWWWRRTPWWDPQQVGLLPVYRLMTLPELPTEPWPAVEPAGEGPS